MTKTGSRTYSVVPADFPIRVTIEAQNLNDNDAIPGDVHVGRDGSPVKVVPVAVTKPNRVTKTYDITSPEGGKGCTMVEAISCFFPSAAPDTALYKFTFKAASGTTDATVAHVPTINPNMVVLILNFK